MTEISLLDGALGQELVRRSGDRATPLWSTSVMLNKPELVAQLHCDYFAAGATIATTNTYAVLRDRLAKIDKADMVPALIDTACIAADTARTAHGSGRIAGSLGPLIASYRPDACPPAKEAAQLYAQNVALMAPRVDLVLIETMCSVDQAHGALMACAGLEIPVWLALSVMDNDGTRLRSGETLQEIAPLLDTYHPQAVLINCSPPEVIADGLKALREMGSPFGAYANGFTEISKGFLKDSPTVDALTQRSDLDPQTYTRFALEWANEGATILGGCCEVGPAHIAHLGKALTSAGYHIT